MSGSERIIGQVPARSRRSEGKNWHYIADVRAKS